MVRVSGLMELAKLPIPPVGPDGLTPAEQLAAIKQRVAALTTVQQRCWHELTGLLREQNVTMLEVDELTGDDLDYLRKRFNEEAIAILTPIAVDPAHPFPFIPNTRHRRGHGAGPRQRRDCSPASCCCPASSSASSACPATIRASSGWSS